MEKYLERQNKVIKGKRNKRQRIREQEEGSLAPFINILFSPGKEG